MLYPYFPLSLSHSFATKSVPEAELPLFIGKTGKVVRRINRQTVGGELFIYGCMEATSTFNILFQGPRDESPDTLRKLKGVFIAELNYSIDEVRRYLDEAPAIVFSTDQEQELHRTFKILEEAGAVVEILGKTLQSAAPSSAEENSLDTPVEEQEGEVLEFTFELDDFTAQQKVSAPKVYTLNLDEEPLEDDVVASLLEEAGAETKSEILPQPADLKGESIPQFAFDDEGSKEPPDTSHVTENLTTSEDALAKDPTPELDLTLSFDDELSSLPELHDKPVYDPYVTGGSTPGEANWELNFETGGELETESPPPVAPPVIPPEPKEGDEASEVSVLFDFEEEMPLEQEATPIESSGAEPSLETVQDVIMNEPPAEAPEIVAPVSAFPDLQEPTQNSTLTPPGATPAQEVHPEVSSQPEPFDFNPDEIPTRSKHRIAKIVAIASIGALLLAINGFLFWSNFLHPAQTVTISDESLDAMIQATVKQQQQEKLAAKAALIEEQTAAASVKKLSGSAENEHGKFWFDFVAEKGAIVSGDIIFSTTAPPPPSKLELARGETRPWIHNAEFGPLRFTETVLGESSARGPIRLYIEQGKERFREIGFATIIIQYDATTDLVAGEIVVSMKESDAAREGVGLEFTGDRQAGFTLSGRVPFSTQLTAPTIE